MAFVNGLSAVLTVFLIGMIGYLLARKKWIAPATARVMPRFITGVVLPPFLLRNVTVGLKRDQLLEILSSIAIPFMSIILAFMLAVVLSRVFNIAKGRRGVFEAAFATSNTMNIGLPINIALFGETAVPYVLLYFVANLVVFWTVGNYGIAREGAHGSDVRLFSLGTVKQMISPPLIGFLTGAALVLLDIQIPSFLDKALAYVGNMAVALSVIYVGTMLESVRLADLHLDRDIVLVFFGRYVASPLTIVALAAVMPIPSLMLKVFIIQSSLPVMLNVAILAGYHGADARYATVLTSITTLLALVTVPVFAVITGFFWP